MQSSTERPGLRDLKLILEERPTALGPFLESAHSADIAAWLESLAEEDAWRTFRALSTERRVEVLDEAEDSVRADLLRYMNAGEIVEIVQELPPDEAVDLLELTDDTTTEQVLGDVDLDHARDLRRLAAYPSETAGGEMTPEFVSVRPEMRIGDAIKVVRSSEDEAWEEGAGVFVVDDTGRLVGFVSDHVLLTTPIHTPISEVMETDLLSVSAEDDREVAARLASKYSLLAVPVVDAIGRLVGILNADDLREVVEVEATEDMVRMAGASEAHQTRLPVFKRVRTRVPLMAVTVLGGLATAYILDMFMGGPTGTSSSSDLLRYLPIVIGLAGNVGIQSSTILVRGFATGEVEPDRELAILASEVVVGIVIGALCGATTALVAQSMETQMPSPALFGSAVGLAILIAVTWASVLGCLIPMSCRRFGIDPAIVAGPFLITLSDISGAAIFMLVASTIITSG